MTQLPQVLGYNSNTFMVMLAGIMTAAQELAIRRAHRVRGARLSALFDFFTRHNRLYSEWNVTRRDGAFFDQAPVFERDNGADTDALSWAQRVQHLGASSVREVGLGAGMEEQQNNV